MPPRYIVCLRKKCVVQIGAHKKLLKETSKSSNPLPIRSWGENVPLDLSRGQGWGWEDNTRRGWEFPVAVFHNNYYVLGCSV